MPLKSIREIGSEVAGNTRQNYLIIQRREEDIRLNFELDSHYMTSQLNKVIAEWRARAYPIERDNVAVHVEK